MPFATKIFPASLLAALAFMTLPVLAQEVSITLFGAQYGDITSLELYDINHNGKLDRIRLTLDNSEHRSWQAKGISGLHLTKDGKDISLGDAFISTPPGAHPAMLEVLINETDPNLPLTTSHEGFEFSYVTQGLGAGIDDGVMEMGVILEGDTNAHDTEIDMAEPVLLSSDPVAGQYRVLRDRPIILTFSEAISVDTLAYASANNPGSWNVTWSDDTTTATLTHGLYRVVLETFTVTAATDLSGNTLSAGIYPNPFTFETTSNNDTQVPDKPHPIFEITHPSATSSLKIDTPNIINWYTNESQTTSVRLSFSSNDGFSYETLTTLPAEVGTFMWYPPHMPGSLILKAESLTASGLVINIVTVNPLSLVLPEFSSTPFNVFGPEAQDITDTSASITMTLDRPVASLVLVCNDATMSTTTGTRTAPSQVKVLLTELTTDTNYTCQFNVTSLTGSTSQISVPAFIASSAGDTTAPAIVDIPKLDMFDADAKTARLSWSTNELSTAHITYGPFLNYGQFADSFTLRTMHTATLSDLAPGELHQARITMIDPDENGAVTDDIWFVFLRDGDLVKSKDASAVYLYKNGKRNVFPNSTIYRSWYGNDFSSVLTIPKTQLGTIALGDNVKMKANSFLVKITSDPKTYAVEPDGTLRWIQTELMARTLYGDAWNTLVRDVDVSLFVDYSIGSPLEDGEVPAGYVSRK